MTYKRLFSAMILSVGFVAAFAITSDGGSLQMEANACADDCKPDGSQVSGSGECCSGKTRWTDSGWVCCSGGDGCS